MSTTTAETTTTAGTGTEQTGQGAGEQTQQATEQQTATPAVEQQAQTTQQATQAAAGGDENPWADPDKAKAEIERLRRENASDRVNAKQAAADEARNELLTALQKALGGDDSKNEQAPTVESLTTQVQEATTARETAEQDAKAARVELAVFKAAAGLDADPVALLDSRTFTDSLADTEPTDDEAITAAIKDAVSKNPRFRKTQAVGASSVEHAGGSGEGAISQEQFNEMSGAQRNELFQTNPTLYRTLAGTN